MKFIKKSRKKIVSALEKKITAFVSAASAFVILGDCGVSLTEVTVALACSVASATATAPSTGD